MLKNKLKNKAIPDTPGVYFFLDKNKKPIYIGKATSLKDRIKSYFGLGIAQVRSPLIEKMVFEAKSIEWKKTDSALEALLLEADLIKKFHPIYNTKEKDDKSFNCIVITKEDFPKLQIIRKRELDATKFKSVFGPYPNGAQLKEALKIIRKIIPYRDDKCVPYAEQIQKKGFARPCFNRQIGLCPGTCTGEISKTDYKKEIKKLELLLSGNIKKLSAFLKKEMNVEAKEKNFEKAGKIRNTIYALNHIQDIALIKSDIGERSVLGSSKRSDLAGGEFKIESYDIAHLAGDATIGVMVVLEDGIENKNLFRKFNIKSAIKGDDVGALKEVLERRLKHREWPYPNLFVVDGGQNQLNSFRAVLNEFGLVTPTVSVVKDENHKPKEILGDKTLAQKFEKEILFANSLTHRAAINVHRKKRRREFLK